MEKITSIIIGIVSSLFASLLFLLFLKSIKPKIDISNNIAKGQDTNGKLVYRIKIINKNNRPITDVKAELKLVSPRNVDEEEIISSTNIKIERPELFIIPKYNLTDENAGYAIRFLIYQKIEDNWKSDEQYLKFRILGHDSFSGFGEVFEKEYHNKNKVIVMGDFVKGDNFEIR